MSCDVLQVPGRSWGRGVHSTDPGECATQWRWKAITGEYINITGQQPEHKILLNAFPFGLAIMYQASSCVKLRRCRPANLGYIYLTEDLLLAFHSSSMGAWVLLSMRETCRRSWVLSLSGLCYYLNRRWVQHSNGLEFLSWSRLKHFCQ